MKVLLLLSIPSVMVSAWVSSSSSRQAFPTLTRRTASTPISTTQLPMAVLDYNDPVVAEEFAKVQPMSYEDVEEELTLSGIRAPPTMNDMDIKLMLVELRLRAQGKMPGTKSAAVQTNFATPYEEALYKNPVFKDFVDNLKAAGDTNAVNVIAELLNDEKTAMERYGKDYKSLISQAKEALTAPPPVTSSKLAFSGFPANMGEAGCKMTLEAVGPIADFECTESEDFPILTGTVTFESMEDAVKAVEQYHGMDMGMGSQLEMTSV